MSKGKQALAALSPEVRAAMYAEVKADFRQRGTNLGNESNQFLERMIENAMIWELTPEQEEHSRSDRRINHKLKEWKQIGPLQRITQIRTHLTASSAMIAELISKLNKGMVGMIDGLILRT
jgi:hypothetical protein